MDEPQCGEWIEKFYSSHIVKFRWGGLPTDDKATMQIVFHGKAASGNHSLKTYVYEDVPKEIYDELVERANSNDSVGKYVNKYIVGNYKDKQVGSYQQESKPERITE